jgi:hypothetical protein
MLAASWQLISCLRRQARGSNGKSGGRQRSIQIVRIARTVQKRLPGTAHCFQLAQIKVYWNPEGETPVLSSVYRCFTKIFEVVPEEGFEPPTKGL